MSSSHLAQLPLLALLAGCTRSRFEDSFKMYVIEWTIIESLSDSTSNFFEVPCSIQKVVKFKARINVQLPLWGSSYSWLFWQAALEAASRTVLRCTLLNGQLLNHYPSQKPNFFEVPCSIQKVVKFKGRINVQLPLRVSAICTPGRLH